MLPIYKWSGGKRKDIKHFYNYLPDIVLENKKYTYVEPFFGAGALYWHLENDDNIINDIDIELINFLNVLKTQSDKLTTMIDDISEKISDITLIEKSGKISISEAKIKRGEFYYEWRNKDRNSGLSNLSDLDRAFRFYFVNQLSFNGMRRFNSKGEFNVPYGNYKAFNKQYDEKHIEMLKRTKVSCGDYKQLIYNNDKKDTFIFLDPPYTREFTEYNPGNDFGDESQIELSNVFKSIKNAKIMLIINKDDFTESLYANYIKSEYDFKYSTNIKNRYSNGVKHLIITNY